MQAYVRDTDINLRTFKVKRAFTIESIFYAVGVVRMFSGAERVAFVQQLRRLNPPLSEKPTQEELQADYAAAEKFFNEHFEEVGYR